VCRGMPPCPWDVCGAVREANLWGIFVGARREIATAPSHRPVSRRAPPAVQGNSAGSIEEGPT